MEVCKAIIQEAKNVFLKKLIVKLKQRKNRLNKIPPTTNR